MEQEYITVTTGSVHGPAGTGGQQTWFACLGCGVLVFNKDIHEAFHDRIGDVKEV